jgi:hypothetical protein
MMTLAEMAAQKAAELEAAQQRFVRTPEQPRQEAPRPPRPQFDRDQVYDAQGVPWRNRAEVAESALHSFPSPEDYEKAARLIKSLKKAPPLVQAILSIWGKWQDIKDFVLWHRQTPAS